jgi:hypothetical protein
LNNPVLFSEEVLYPLAEFVSNYYEMEFSEFKEKFERLPNCPRVPTSCGFNNYTYVNKAM